MTLRRPVTVTADGARLLAAKLHNGIALHQAGRLAEAQKVYGEILREQPAHFDAQHLLGVIAFQTGAAARAAELIRRAIAINAKEPVAHNNLGNVLKVLRRPAEALTRYDRAVRLKPDYVEAWYNHGCLLGEMRRFAEAAASFERVIALKPDYAEAHYNLAAAQADLGRYDEAAAGYRRAVALKPDYVEALLNLGNVLRKLNRHAEAAACFDAVIASKPDYAEAHYNLGNAHKDLERYEAALASYDRAIALDPALKGAHLARGTLCLRLGRFAEGWRGYEQRDPSPVRPYSQPLWLGKEDIAGKTLLLYWEQGFGDTIQFCRYAKLAKAQGAKVVLSVQNPLKSLLRRLDPDIEIIGETAAPAEFDYHSPLLSLPFAFGTELGTIPLQPHYLEADAAVVARWRIQLGDRVRPRIGLVWSGNPHHANDRNRSLPLETVLPLLTPAADWIAIQKDIRDHDRRLLKDNGTIRHFGKELHDFRDTAALLATLDLVITVDTAVAHLAGAMGIPVWIALPQVPDWRWLRDREDSPWYPSVRLFRQSGGWAELVERMAAAVQARLA